ncbi:tetratricopeptide repeat protein [Pantoea tagorei]
MRQTPPRQKSALTPSPVAMQARLENAAARFRQHMAQQDYAAAASCCEEVLRAMPNQMQVLSDYALCLLRLGHYSKAYWVYQKIYQAPPAVRATASETWLDGLAELCGWMGRQEELAKYGLEALNGADARFRQGQRYAFPAARPEPIDLTRPEQNVIAFSLYGGQPRYCETLIKKR